MPIWGRPLLLRYVVDQHDEFILVEGDWDAFAAQNGARQLSHQQVLGRLLWDYIEGPETRHLYRTFMEKVREKRITFEFTYRCDAPDVMRLLKLQMSSRDGKNVLFCSELLSEEERDPAVPRLVNDPFAMDGKVVVMCSICKKVNISQEWQQLDAAVEALRLLDETEPYCISHGLCEPCSRQMAAMLDFAS